MARRIWWATWPGALVMGLVAAVLASAGTAVGLVGLFVPVAGIEGTDQQAVAAPGWLFPLSLSLSLAGVVLPLLTLWWARRRWAGFVLLGLCLSAVVGAVGLVQFGLL